ncbi:response regulator [Hansschlegelia beijingensis]|uniref:DNA-binding NarL/FixJ family response regulator n=1 Tax=Hansschlegelia beijingensis TaxID=1133344 RepID=A0A7W6CXS5_9HYPH|nr:response regulator [Hansschlegelia beijingensis]MBB3972217.1 DNA-binding NarL/FixJ family response regulator [Hansschlegelia beijingensis]
MRVLILEDQAIVGLEVEAIVRARLPGATVTLAATIREGRDVARGTVDLALLDIDVADGKTYELASDLDRAGARVIFVSGSTRADTPQGLTHLAFISKPFSHFEIVRAIEEACAEAPRARRTEDL